MDNSDLEYIEKKYLPILKEMFDKKKEQNPDLKEEDFYEEMVPKIISSIMQHHPGDEGFEEKIKQHLQGNKSNQDQDKDILRESLNPDQYGRLLEIIKGK